MKIRTLSRIAVLGGLILCLGAAAVQDGKPIDSARAALEKWVSTRQLISQEQRDWRLGREMLESRIELVQREIDSIGAKQKEAQGSIAEADKQRAVLLEDNERFKASSASLETTLRGLEARTLELLARLPGPLRERVQPLSQRLPAPDAATKLSLGERFQNVVGILNEVNKFQREIHVASEVHPLAGGSSAEVTALYLGIAQAFFVDARASAAAIGTSSADGFAWKSAPQAAASIARAIAILGNEAPAEFVPLPIVIE